MKYVKFFNQIIESEKYLVGGKGYSLGILSKYNLPIPNGFVILSTASNYFYENNFPDDFWTEIEASFNELDCESVAVRSSAVAEDSAQNSWAGQLDTFLNISKIGIQEAVKNCFNSINSQRAKAYALSNKIDNKNIAVVVQKMVNSQKAGVLFTVNPVNNDRDEIMIEGVYGLGELLVGGEVIPYNYVLNKSTLEIKTKTVSDQQVILRNTSKGVEKINFEKTNQEEFLSNNLLQSLAKLSLEVEKIYKIPQDIEWGIENDIIYILQSRPITTLNS